MSKTINQIVVPSNYQSPKYLHGSFYVYWHSGSLTLYGKYLQEIPRGV